MKSDAAIVEKVIAQLDREPLSKTFIVNHTTPAEMADMICKIDEIIEYLSQYFTFKIGDIIYSGFGSEAVTLAIDQVLHGSINGKEVLNIKVK